MRSPAKIVVLLVASALAGCQTYPDQPSRTVIVAGNYKAIADCFYLKVANPRGFQKVDLDSISTTRITAGDGNYTTLRLDFVGRDPGHTEVRAFLGQAFGASNWKNSYEPIIQQCAKGST